MNEEDWFWGKYSLRIAKYLSAIDAGKILSLLSLKQ
jgi:hypothetical protein